MQPQGHVQILVNLIDFGMNVQEAGDAPRVRHDGSSEPTGEVMRDGGEVVLETGFSPETVKALQARGHKVTRRATTATSAATRPSGAMSRASTSARRSRARTARRRVTEALPGTRRPWRQLTCVGAGGPERPGLVTDCEGPGSHRGVQAIGASTSRRSAGAWTCWRHRQRQCDAERGADAGLGSAADAPAVRIDDALADVQPEPRAGLLVLFAGRVVRVEDVRQILGGDPGPGVRDLDVRRRCRACGWPP